MYRSYISSHREDICESFRMYEASAVVLYSRESMEILHEMLTDLESSLGSLGLDTEACVDLHSCEYFLEDWSPSIGEKTPRISI